MYPLVNVYIRLHNYGKIFKREINYLTMAMFNSYVTNYQRVFLLGLLLGLSYILIKTMVYGRVVISKNIFMVGYVTNMNGRMADDIPNCGWLIPTAGFREIPIDAIDSPCCAHFLREVPK